MRAIAHGGQIRPQFKPAEDEILNLITIAGESPNDHSDSFLPQRRR